GVAHARAHAPGSLQRAFGRRLRVTERRNPRKRRLGPSARWALNDRLMTEKDLDQNALDTNAVERILAAVGAKFIPADLDEQKLVTDVASCFTVYSSAVQRRSDKPTKDRIHRLKSIQEATKRLEEQLAPDDVWDWSDRYSECEYLQAEVQYLTRSLDSEIE